MTQPDPNRFSGKPASCRNQAKRETLKGKTTAGEYSQKAKKPGSGWRAQGWQGTTAKSDFTKIETAGI
jgi:hypothetical protein